MVRKFSIWSLFIACFPVMGHTVFPHTHQQDAYKASLYAELNLPVEDGLFTFFSQLFSQDLGDNHLEEFNQAADEVPVPLYLAQVFLHTLLYLDSEDALCSTFAFPPYINDLGSRLVLSDAPLRAPPQA